MNMMNGRVFASLLIVMSLIVVIWMFRYDIIPAGGSAPGFAAFRLDRWTGNVVYIIAGNGYDVVYKGKLSQ